MNVFVLPAARAVARAVATAFILTLNLTILLASRQRHQTFVQHSANTHDLSKTIRRVLVKGLVYVSMCMCECDRERWNGFQSSVQMT